MKVSVPSSPVPRQSRGLRVLDAPDGERTSLRGVVLAFVLLTPSCFVEARGHDYVAATDGTLVVDWTIEGSKAPVACDLSSADRISIAVSDSYGESVGDFRQSCDAFATSIDLPIGAYSGDALLLQGAASQRTTAVPLGPLRIYGGDEVVVKIDFPADSFY